MATLFRTCMSKLSALAQTALVVILIILIVMVGAAGYLASNSRTITFTLTLTAPAVTTTDTFTTLTLTARTVTTTFTFTTTESLAQQTLQITNSTNFALNPKLGIELEGSLNSTRIDQGAGLSLNMTLINTLTVENNLSQSNSWAIAGMGEEPCNSFSPTSFTVFQGYYGFNNYSTAKPLDLWPVVPACSAPLTYNGTSMIGALRNVTSYSFSAQSDVANYSAYYIPWGSTNGTVQFGTFPATGWTAVTSRDDIFTNSIFANESSEPTITPATPGDYTIAIGDEWGDLAFIYFSIV